jgi:Ca2+-binding EF-hand superfamily protein
LLKILVEFLAQLQQALQDLGHEADEEKVAEMVSEVGKGGVVDFEGFLKLVTSDKRLDPSKNAKAMLSKAKIKKYQKAFHAFDIDGSGEIDAWELKVGTEFACFASTQMGTQFTCFTSIKVGTQFTCFTRRQR